MNNIFSENIKFNNDPISDLKIEMQSNLPSFYTSLRENIFKKTDGNSWLLVSEMKVRYFF